MTKTFLKSVSSANSKFPKELLIWNYWDHEHIVGTHFEHADLCHFEQRPYYGAAASLWVLDSESGKITN